MENRRNHIIFAQVQPFRLVKSRLTSINKDERMFKQLGAKRPQRNCP